MSSAVQIRDLSKRYRLGVIGTGTLRHDLQGWWARARGKEDPNSKISFAANGKTQSASQGDFWALDGVSLEVRQGEMLGIIGRNGAGKSTLLKILSRVTSPTTGEVRIRGRVTSLLEVGTGFHPELTGRENVFLNGAILGMSRADIRKRFDEIIDFSGVEQFIDTPVKRYSSGMYVRLAFAVAAHMEPEILIVDEVLSVGDFDFQRKCIGKMGEVTSRQGRTVLFVSHNIGAVQSLCNRAVLLKKGKVVADGAPLQIIDHYLHGDTEVPGERIWQEADAPGFEGCVRMKSIRLVSTGEEVKTVFDVKDSITVEMEYEVLREKFVLDAHLYFYRENSEPLFVAMSSQAFGENRAPDRLGVHRRRVTIPPDLLTEGMVRVQYLLCTYPTTPYYSHFNDAVAFTMVDDRKPSGSRGRWTRDWPTSMFRPRLAWEIDK